MAQSPSEMHAMSPEISPVAMLGWLARARAIQLKGTYSEAEEWLAAHRAPDQVRRVFKTAIGAGSTVDSDLQYGIHIGQWSDTLRTRSVFYRILADAAFTRVPINQRIGVVTSAASGAVVGEGHAIPVSKVRINNVLLSPLRVAALIVCTDTLLMNVSAAGQQLFSRELMSAVSDAVDGAFLQAIVHTGITSTPSAGVTAVNAKHDLRTALLAVNTVGAAKLYWIASPDVATKASTLADTAGLDAFPAMSATGGEMAGLPCLVASGVPAGELFLIDASGIAVDAGPPTVSVSGNADIAMDTSPTMTSSGPSAANLVSMYATNSTALKCETWIGAAVLRNNAVAVVTGINWT
jgi:HK97 family phage major capsid protein